jgi:RNA recognition motif-containing protein
MKRLRLDITEEELRREFSKAGEVLELKLFEKNIIDKDSKQVVGKSKQGYIRMADHKAAQCAIQKFDGEEFFGRRFLLDYWQDKHDLKQEKIHNQQSQMTQLMTSFSSLFNK